MRNDKDFPKQRNEIKTGSFQIKIPTLDSSALVVHVPTKPTYLDR